jgi:hypothetical protein
MTSDKYKNALTGLCCPSHKAGRTVPTLNSRDFLDKGYEGIKNKLEQVSSKTQN